MADDDSVTMTTATSRITRDAMPPRRKTGLIGGLAVALALTSAIGTFLVLSGSTPVAPVHTVVISLFVLNGVLILTLLAVIGFEAIGLIRARRAGEAASGLHVWVVTLFGIIAALPAILSAIISTVTIERALEPWFSDRMRDAIFRAVDVSDAYTGSICRNLGREVRILADDLARARPAFDTERAWFENFLTVRASALGLPVAQIMTGPDDLLVRAKIDVIASPPKPDAASIEEARQSGDPICSVPRNGRMFSAVMKLQGYNDAIIFVAREADQLAIDVPALSREAAAEYLSIDARRQGVKVAFASMFALISLILLLSAIWLGLNFANRLVSPIRRLIHATDQVSSGNFYVQVPVNRADGDLAHLGSTFNKMTSELRQQRDGLVSASEQNESRRRFTETVLSGVSSGVVGIVGEGRITLMNPSAERLLALSPGSVGSDIRRTVPELDEVVREALTGRSRMVRGQISLLRDGRETLMNVRISREGEGAGQGFVLTLDDITDLVSAQRTAAWADVARRIAHEIKNPLTPIQLSAERIQRRFGKVILEGREVFDQCTQTIIRQVDDIRRMVDEFSSFARMPKAQPEADDLADTVRQAAFLMRVGHPGVEVVESGTSGTMPARFDRRLVSQALTNVIKNGCEAIEAVAAEKRDGPARVDIALQQSATGIATIDILDTGKGLPVDSRHRLLEPYMTTREGGTGLGLPIVAKIFEDHGGGIELLDRPDGRRGALIRLWFPLAGPEPSPDVAEPHSKTPLPERL